MFRIYPPTIPLIGVLLLLLSACAAGPESVIRAPLPEETAEAPLRPITVGQQIVTPIPTVTPTPSSGSQNEDSDQANPGSSSTAEDDTGCAQRVGGRHQTICFQAESGGHQFPYPIGMAIQDEAIYLLDGGRVLELSLPIDSPPIVLLEPGDEIADIPVLEPLDLTATDDGLVVLDRAGDTYFYSWAQKIWTLERYDRPITETSSHYYVALTGAAENRFLLENSYQVAYRYTPDMQRPSGWTLSERRQVDFAVDWTPERSRVFILTQSLEDNGFSIERYTDGRLDADFELAFMEPIARPRELRQFDGKLYLLDQAGYQLTAFSNDTGRLIEVRRFNNPVSTMTIDDAGAIWLAGSDAIHRLGFTEPDLVIESVPLWPADPIHAPQVWQTLPQILLPIENLPVSPSEQRLPGAPRHYRLGVHEGIDFYWGPGRPIQAVADGTVIRAEIDYLDPPPRQFDIYRNESRENGQSSEEALDFYRGRQVWIEHADGSISRYAHMQAIDESIAEGVEVTAGQRLGEVGNSGSPGSLEGPAVDSHLHFELWIGENFVGRFLRPVEIREIYEGLFIP